MGERTYLVIVDDGDFIRIGERGALIHDSFRKATQFADDDVSVDNIKKTLKLLPSGKLYRVHATLEEVQV